MEVEAGNLPVYGAHPATAATGHAARLCMLLTVAQVPNCQRQTPLSSAAKLLASSA